MEFHIDDKVRNGRLVGIITGFNGTEYRVYWNSTNDMYHEFMRPESLELVECPHA